MYLSTKLFLATVCLVVCASFAACTESSEPEDISFQVKVIYYKDAGQFSLEGVWENASPYDLERVSLNEVRVFFQTPWGWDFYPRPPSSKLENDREFLLYAGEIEKLSLGAFVPVYDMVYRKGPFLLEMRYRILPYEDNDIHYVIYSNEFTVPETLDEELLPIVRVTVQDLQQRKIVLHNGTDEVLCFKPLCSEISTPRADERLTTLQRQTEQGTWQIFYPDRNDCIQAVAPVKIEPGAEVPLELWARYPIERLNLPSGNYRWEVVLFRFDRIAGGFSWAVHIFTESIQFP